MHVGSVEYVAIGFPGNNFTGEIIPAMRELVEKNVVRILDLAFIRKDENGNIDAVELSALDPRDREQYSGLEPSNVGLLNEDDITSIGDALEPNSSAGLIVWENLWSARFAEAVERADGVLLATQKIPAPVVKEALEYAEQQDAGSSEPELVTTGG